MKVLGSGLEASTLKMRVATLGHKAHNTKHKEHAWNSQYITCILSSISQSSMHQSRYCEGTITSFHTQQIGFWHNGLIIIVEGICGKQHNLGSCIN